MAIVRPAVGIDAVYQDRIAGFDAVSGFLNRPERARFGAGVGVRAGRRDMVSAPAVLGRRSDTGRLRLRARPIGGVFIMKAQQAMPKTSATQLQSEERRYEC